MEFVSLSPAMSMRQRVRYSTGDEPTVAFLQGPATCRIVVNGGDCGVQLRIGESKQSPGPATSLFLNVQAQRLNQHHNRELLRDERPTGAVRARLLAQLLKTPAKLGLVGLRANMDDGR